MRITVRLFAILREKAGARQAELELANGADVSAAARALAAKFPALSPLIPRVAFAVNHAYASCDRVLNDGDELALIPAVSGGSPDGNDWIAILPTPLPLDLVIAFISHVQSGGHAIFLGTTRKQTDAQRGELMALDYEAYDDMALGQFRDMAAGARQKWPILKLAILHRTGRVNITEPSVLIAVSTPHRGAAFDACRWLIDTLKQQSTIWKKEIWADGSATWSEPHSS